MSVRADEADGNDALHAHFLHRFDEVARALQIRGLERVPLGLHPDAGQMHDVRGVIERHPQRRQIVQVAGHNVHLHARRKPALARRRTDQAAHGILCFDELFDEMLADEAGGASDENHEWNP